MAIYFMGQEVIEGQIKPKLSVHHADRQKIISQSGYDTTRGKAVLDRKTGQIYQSISDAAADVGVNQQTMTQRIFRGSYDGRWVLARNTFAETKK